MANPALTWKNVNSKDPSNLIRTGLAAGETLGDSFSSLGSRISDFADDKSKRETNEFVADIMAMDTNEEREQAIAAAENSFLDMGTIADKSYAFGADERALNTQIAAEGRLASAEDIINTRELGEAKNLLQASEKREDDLLEQSIDYEADIFDRDNLYNAELLENSQAYDKELLKTAKTYESDIFERNNDRNDKVRMLEQKFITEERLYGEMITDERNLEAAAQEQVLAKIEADLKEELAKIEAKSKVDLAKIKKSSDLSKKVLANEIKNGTGLEKTMNRYSLNGTLEDTDFDSKDMKAYEDVKGLMLDTGISLKEFETFFGDNVNWNDNVLGALYGNPNEFSFSHRGERYTFGKKGWIRIFKSGGLNQSSVSGGTMGALEAAIKQDTSDQDAKNLSFQTLSSMYKNNTETVRGKIVKKPIEFNKKIFDNLWNNYRNAVRESSDPWALLDVNVFIGNINKYAAE